MALDLQKLILRRLLESRDTDLYSKLVPKYFDGSNLMIYGKIESFYRNNLRVPNIEEFSVIRKEISLQDYFDAQILGEQNKNDDIQNEFLLAQLQDHAIREETIVFIDRVLEDLEDLERVEIIDKFQNHLLELNRTIPMSDELINVAEVDVAPKADTFVMFPSGLSAEYDAVNGGLALQELVMIGGRRGSGKSILVLNMALHRFLQGHTTSLFSIEMRYLEVYYRTLSILTEIPFLSYMRNMLTDSEKFHAAKVKMETFYEEGQQVIQDALGNLEENSDITKFDLLIRTHKPKMKENRFFIIDDPTLSLNRIDHYDNLFHNKYPDYSLSAVDYLNIIQVPDSKDWKVQIDLAEGLKMMSRKYNITKVSPYQVDSTLEARYAKGILDSADRAFVFSPKQSGDEDPDRLTLYTAKIRNGKNITFDVFINWECVKVDPSGRTQAVNAASNLLPGTQHGSGLSEENARDV